MSDTESLLSISEFSQVTADTSNVTSTAPQRSARYYNEMAVFQVENTLYRESKRYFAANSEYFRGLFTLPSGETNRAGQSDENPIKLKDVTVVDFERLLSVIYPISLHEQVTQSPEVWKSVIKLSTKWEILTLREHCIAKLSPLPSDMPVTSKIQFARECLVSSWLVDAYNELAQRMGTLTEEDISAIGLQSGNRILRVRENWYVDMERGGSSRIAYNPSSRKAYDFRDAIRTVFRDEINNLNQK